MKKLALFLLLFTYVCLPLQSQESVDIFTYRVGEFKISLLSEAQQNASPGILIGVTSDILNKYVPTGSFRNAMNAYLVQTKDKNILIDTGLGKNIYRNLYGLGITSDQIDIILITHMHGDHIGGMLQEGEVMFPNADIYLPQPEYDYWTSDDEMYQVPESGRMSFTFSRQVIDAYAGRLHLFMPCALEDLNSWLFPGIQPIQAYGHTPGHTVYLLESGNSKLLIWGDLTHAMAVQMPHPEIAVTYDVNPEQAIQSREKILEFVTKNYISIAGMHIAYPGMGRIAANPEGGYVYTSF
ncbi:MAG: MBL fold metallo-hydrolase [Tannerellaceae bacterium]|nr:MBL fold metallo-hydrolase [Tannerellaceae bacterium]